MVYNALRDLPGRYSLCTHSLTQLYLLDMGEAYGSVQWVCENSSCCRLFTMDWETTSNDFKLVHLVYEALRDLLVWYYLCTHSLSELFGSDFAELYRYVQKVYENAVHCRLFYIVW